MSVNQISQFAAEEATGIATLGIDVKALLLQAGTFLILYLVFRKYALGKVVHALADRREKINEGLDNAELMEKKTAELKEEVEAELKRARIEAEGIVAKAHEESGLLINKAEEEAAERAETIIVDARRTTEADVKKAKKQLRTEMLELVATATETVLDEKIDQQKDGKLIEKALAGVEVE